MAATSQLHVACVASAAGRKHHVSATRVVQEDMGGSCAFAVALRDGGCERAWACYVCDGHGVALAASASSEPSGAERFQSLLRRVLPTTLERICNEAAQKSDLCAALEESLESLNDTLDAEMAILDEHLCKENGSTISLCLLIGAHLFACNIGDSQILAFDRNDTDAKPMKIWRLKRHHLASEEERESAAGGEKSASEADTDDEGHRIHAAASNSTSDDTLEGATPIKTKAPLAISTPASSTSTARMLPSPTDPDAHVCAYPDSLFLQEGTAQKYISKDYAFLRQRAVLAGGGGPMGGYIHSIKSRYRLGMTCSVGNASHKGNLIVRSNVYVFPLEALLERSIGGRVTFVLTSDGIKDLVKSHQIGQTLANLSHSLRILSGSTSGAGVTPTKRKPISACIADLITRPTLDGHDRNAREHLEDLVELFEKATEGLAGSPTTNPRAAAARQRNKELEVYTDTRVAVEALVDLAILRGATDDVTVAAFDLVCASRNPQSGTAQNDPSTESVSEEVSRSDESHEIVWDRSSQQWRFGSVLPLPGLLPVRKPLQPSAIIEKILAVVAGAQEKKIATEALNIVKPPPPFTPSKEEGLVAAQVGLSSGSGSVEDEHGKAAPFVVGFGVAALDEIFKKVDTVNGAGFLFGSGHKTGVELESDDGICMENVNGLPGLGASNMELNVSESNMDLNNDAGIEENAGYSSRKRKY